MMHFTVIGERWLCSFPSERPPQAQKNISFICVVVPIKLLIETERVFKNAGLRFVFIIQFSAWVSLSGQHLHINQSTISYLCPWCQWWVLIHIFHYKRREKLNLKKDAHLQGVSCSLFSFTHTTNVSNLQEAPA